MPQQLVYRDSPYVIGDEIAGHRKWFIRPINQKPQYRHQGMVLAAAGPSSTATGTFRRSGSAAWQAIDRLLDGEMTPEA